MASSTSWSIKVYFCKPVTNFEHFLRQNPHQEELLAKVILFKLQCSLQYFKGFISVDTSNISISINQTCKIRLWYFLIQSLKILSFCFGNCWITKKVSLWKQKTSSVNKIKNYFIYIVVVSFCVVRCVCYISANYCLTWF